MPPKRPSKVVKSTHKSLNKAPLQRLAIYVFGAGEYGELGLGHLKQAGKQPKNVRRPRLNGFLDAETVGVVQIAVGGMHCIALTAENELLTWGVNDNAALGRDTKWAPPEESESDDGSSDGDDSGLNPRESTPTAMDMEGFAQGVRFAQVEATDSASFALTEDGDVYGWGTFGGADGVIGFTKERTVLGQKIQKQPILLSGLKNITRLAAGGNHIIALDSTGKLFTWGSGGQGQLGRPVVEKYQHHALMPHFSGLPKKINFIATGSYHSFAIDGKNQVWAWGLNNYGQTGISDGAGTERAIISKPKIVDALKDYKIVDIQGGSHHSIACTEDGKVLVWGRCDDGQTGILTDKIDSQFLLRNAALQPKILLKPTIVPGIVAHKVAAGIDNCFAVTKEGYVYSWGFSANWRTGLGTENPVLEATRVENTAVKDEEITFAACGGQFSVIAGPVYK